MNLYILRHGIAAEPGAPGVSDDASRPLVPKGEQRLREIAAAMKAMELSFDLLLSSPYLRARQTAEIIAGAFKARKKLELTDELAPQGSPKKLIEAIRRREPPPENVLLTGHEPYLSELISLLATGHPILSVTMKKGGLCKLVAEPLRPGRCATLEWLLTPKQMALMT